MLKLRLSCLLTAPILLTLPAYIAEHLVYGIASVDAFYLFVGVQILFQSISGLSRLSFFGWTLVVYSPWLGFCWILAHLIAKALTTKQTHQHHLVLIIIGIGLPFMSSGQNLFIQAIIYSFSLFLMAADVCRTFPIMGLIWFFIPWMPFLLGNSTYNSGEVFQQIQIMFEPSEASTKVLSPSRFKFWSTVSKDPFKVASGVPSSILIPLAKTSLTNNGEGQIEFSSHFRKIQPVLVKHYPLYFIFREHNTDLFLGFHSLLDFLVLAESSSLNLGSRSKVPPAAVLYSQVFNSYNVLANYWPQDQAPSLDLALKISDPPVSLALAHRIFDNSIWHQFSQDPKLKSIIQKPQFFIDGAQWMIDKGRLKLAQSLIFQLEQIPKQTAASLILRTKLAESKADYWTALDYAQQYKSSFNDNRIDEDLYRLLKICEQDFVNYGKDFPYALLVDLSRKLYDQSGGKGINYLMDSLRYQREQLPRAISDSLGCMNCAKEQLIEKRKLEKLKSLMQNRSVPEKGPRSPSETSKALDNLIDHKHP